MYDTLSISIEATILCAFLLGCSSVNVWKEQPQLIKRVKAALMVDWMGKRGKKPFECLKIDRIIKSKYSTTHYSTI